LESTERTTILHFKECETQNQCARRSTSEIRGLEMWIHAAHCMSQLLFAAEISLGSLNRRMTEEELDLLPFSSRQMAESRTCSTQIMGSKVLDSGLVSRRFDDTPDCFHCDPFSSLRQGDDSAR
jgi:hypothetical protein